MTQASPDHCRQPTQAEIDWYVARAHRLRAEAAHAGLAAVRRGIARRMTHVAARLSPREPAH